MAAQVAMFRETAEKAGRDPNTLEVGALVSTCAVDGDQKLDVMRRLVAFQTHRLNQEEADRRGIELEAYHRIKATYARHAAPGGRVMYGAEPAAYEAVPHVTPAMLRAFAVVGTPDECARQLERYVAAGVTLPILLPTGCDIGPVIETGSVFLSQT